MCVCVCGVTGDRRRDDIRENGERDGGSELVIRTRRVINNVRRSTIPLYVARAHRRRGIVSISFASPTRFFPRIFSFFLFVTRLVTGPFFRCLQLPPPTCWSLRLSSASLSSVRFLLPAHLVTISRFSRIRTCSVPVAGPFMLRAACYSEYAKSVKID